MPRQRRDKGDYSIYHIIQRGNERHNIFISEDDKTRFVETLFRMKEKYDFKIYAYCLMDNHVHLIIDDNGNDISQILKSINVSYVFYFNRIYNRCGHLFQDRFKSEMVDDERYLLELSKYIHNNPVRANMVKEPGEYKWSSYNLYTGILADRIGLVDINKVLGIINRNSILAIKRYIEYVNRDEINKEIKMRIMDID